MAKVYIVSYIAGGFDEPVDPHTVLAGAYTDPDKANIHRGVVSGTVTTLDLDSMPIEVFAQAKNFGLIK